MKKWLLGSVALLILIIPTVALAFPSVYPTGTTIYKPEKCWNGYTILSVGTTMVGHDPEAGVPLIDMNGNVVHEWKKIHPMPVRVFPGGRCFAPLSYPKIGGDIFADVAIQVDFEGKTEWSWAKNLQRIIKAPDGTSKNVWSAMQHHDMQREPNPVGYYAPGLDPYVDKGKTLILCGALTDLYLVEVSWDGEILWKWDFNDHAKDPELQGVRNFSNCSSWLGPNKWYDEGDERFHPDNIIMDDGAATIYIISKKTGKIVWHVGPDYPETSELRKLGINLAPLRKTAKTQLPGTSGCFVGGMLHHAHMIPRGLPGEGNILVFNNGMPFSQVLEFCPKTLKVVWEYSGIALGYSGSHSLAHSFFSPTVSSAQRLPNGNTLICEGDGGRLIEVTKDLEIVWEYIYPNFYLPGGFLELCGETGAKDSKRTANSNLVYRAYRVPYEWVPQLEKPFEQAVTPPDITNFRLSPEISVY